MLNSGRYPSYRCTDRETRTRGHGVTHLPIQTRRRGLSLAGCVEQTYLDPMLPSAAGVGGRHTRVSRVTYCWATATELSRNMVVRALSVPFISDWSLYWNADRRTRNPRCAHLNGRHSFCCISRHSKVHLVAVHGAGEAHCS